MKTLTPFIYYIQMNKYYYWNIKKQKINSEKNYNNPKEREIWWCSLGYNIGREIYGKGPNFSRPVLVIRQFKGLFLGIPLTSNLESSKFKIKIYTSDNKPHGLLLDQVRCLDKRRLISKMYVFSKRKYKKICRKFNSMLKK